MAWIRRKPKLCIGLKKYLAGEAPAAEDVPGMLGRLETQLHGNAQIAAQVMVAIQMSHQAFVPVLAFHYGMSKFTIEFFREATTVAGLKVCAFWTFGEDLLVEFLAHRNSSISTLDFSLAGNWQESESAKKALATSLVNTWQRCPGNWPGLNFIGDDVHELKLSGAFSDVDMQNLQTVLQRGNIKTLALEAESSAEHLRLALAVHHANSNGGLVDEVRLSATRTWWLYGDKQLVPEILKVLSHSRGIISVTLPDARWLSQADLATLKEWLRKGSIEFLKVAHMPMWKIEADAYGNAWQRSGPCWGEQVANSWAPHSGPSSGRGAGSNKFGMKLEEYLTPRDFKALLIVNKHAYVTARQYIHARQAAPHRSEPVPDAPATDLVSPRSTRRFKQRSPAPSPNLAFGSQNAWRTSPSSQAIWLPWKPRCATSSQPPSTLRSTTPRLLTGNLKSPARPKRGGLPRPCRGR